MQPHEPCAKNPTMAPRYWMTQPNNPVMTNRTRPMITIPIIDNVISITWTI